jgi:hypothetical protein
VTYFHQMHLRKSGSGISARTACGRNILRTQMSCCWEDFKLHRNQCELCATSKQAELNARSDANKWVPEAPDAWKLADDKLVAERMSA